MEMPAVYPEPPARRLRVYAFDPQASTRIETAAINCAVISLPWESRWDRPLAPGPTNEYLEVIDIDPASGQFYRPIDLNHAFILAQDGLAPSEGDPRFHQQMTLAIAMKTIKAFERALGRRIFWAPEWKPDESKGAGEGAYYAVDRLRIYPHALREPNAYYSRDKKALLFGYFRASTTDPGSNLPGGWVFTALSHDIIVHETTHAILDGLHRRYAEPTSSDSLAFHEAFSDMVALLSHFTLREAVADQIARSGGDLSHRSVLSGLARQFGEATGRYAALRDGIDEKAEDGLPDPAALYRSRTPHERGAVLVAALFDAFVTIYERRTADLMRIASIDAVSAKEHRTLHPDLVKRLAAEASKSADHLLRMCLRALDYLPPIDVRFGEFLRAIVTADTDLVSEDRLHYRLAVIEAFRRRGIVPEDCLSLAPDSLLWEPPDENLDAKDLLLQGKDGTARLDLEPRFRRQDAFQQAEKNRKAVWDWLMVSEGQENDRAWERALGIHFCDSRKTGKGQVPKVEVHSVRMTRRAGPEGQELRQLVIEITQRRKESFDPGANLSQDHSAPSDATSSPCFYFRGGATVIVDLRDGTLRYVIRKRIDDEQRLEEQRNFLQERQWAGLGFTYCDLPHGYALNAIREPFAMIHRGG